MLENDLQIYDEFPCNRVYRNEVKRHREIQKVCKERYDDTRQIQATTPNDCPHNRYPFLTVQKRKISDDNLLTKFADNAGKSATIRS